MRNENMNEPINSQSCKTRVTGSACIKHDFREFWKTNYYGRLKLKETKCIYCYENRTADPNENNKQLFLSS